jgi:CheY-like chemotaxis protein
VSSETEKRRILVVDDDPDVVTFITAFLNDQGYEVLPAAGGDEALALAREHLPDLICLDISMPAPTGVRVYRELRGDPILANIPVIMVTGVPAQFEQFISTRRQVPPPDGYVRKPFTAEDIREAVEKVFASRPLEA